MKGDKLAKISLLSSVIPLILIILSILTYRFIPISKSLGSLILLLSFIFPITSIILSIIVFAKKMEGRGYAIGSLILSLIDMIILSPFTGISLLGDFF